MPPAVNNQRDTEGKTTERTPQPIIADVFGKTRELLLASGLFTTDHAEAICQLISTGLGDLRTTDLLQVLSQEQEHQDHEDPRT